MRARSIWVWVAATIIFSGCIGFHSIVVVVVVLSPVLDLLYGLLIPFEGVCMYGRASQQTTAQFLQCVLLQLSICLFDLINRSQRRRRRRREHITRSMFVRSFVILV